MSLSKLHVAAGNGDLATLKLFLTNDDVNQLGTIGRTLLHTAAQKGRTDVVKELLGRKAALNLRDKHGRTPLHVAAHSGHERTAAELCEAGADLEAQTASGRTPLHLAAWGGKAGVCAVLANQGARLQARDQGGKTALHLAAWSGQLAVAEQLLRLGAEVEVDDESGRTALLVAAKFGHGDIVHALLEQGANQAAKDHKGSSAGDLAAAGGYAAVQEVLRKFEIKKSVGSGRGSSTEAAAPANWTAGKSGAGSKGMQLSGKQGGGRSHNAIGEKRAALPKGGRTSDGGGAEGGVPSPSPSHLAVHVDLTKARTLGSAGAARQSKLAASKVPSRCQPTPDSASSLDVTVDELAVGVGTQGSVAFGRSEPQKGAAQGLMLTNPAYITENCSDCSIFVDGNSSRNSGLETRQTETIGGNTLDVDASVGGWSDESIDEILQEMAAEPGRRQAPAPSAPRQQILEIPEEMADLCASRKHAPMAKEDTRNNAPSEV